jgi:acyl-CoA synthetase (AMP-forming)/AMP-acid ligase II
MDTNFRYVKEVFPETCLKRMIVTNYVDLLPMYKRVFGMLFDKVPQYLEFRDMLPKSKVGKLLRREVREEERRRLEKEKKPIRV